jgi:putative PEP-CTERM system TPR-repeat lipoprotein
LEGVIVRAIRIDFLPLACAVIVAGLMCHPARADAPDLAAAKKYVAQADEFLAKGDLKSALVVLKDAKKADPLDGAIRTKLGGVELRLNDLEGAQLDLKAAHENGGDELTVIPLLGRAYTAQGKFDAVLQELPVRDDMSTEIRVETLAVRANAQIGLNHLQDARASLTEAEMLKPTSGVLKFALANLDMREGSFDSALERVNDAIKIEPSADAHYLKSQILFTKHDPGGAMTEVNAAIALDPDHVGALIERTQLLIDLGQDARANTDVGALLKIAPQLIPARYFQALLLSRAQDYVSADTILTKYEAGFKTFPQGYLLQAMVKSQLKQYEAAETAINAYLAPMPDDPRGRKFQAQILMDKGDFVQAADILDTLTDEHPDDAEAFAMLGEALRTVSPERSAEAFTRATKLAPDNPTALRGLALDDLIGGRSGAGIADMEKVVKLSPDDTGAAESLAMAYLAENRYADADRLIADLTAKHANDPVIADMPALSAMAQSRAPEAKTDFEAVAKRFPDFLPPKLELAKIYESEGDRDKAKAAYAAILEKHPENVQALQGISKIFILDNQPGQLLDQWKKAYRAQPDNIAIDLGVIQAYIDNKDSEGALSAVRDMQVRQPKEPRLYRARATLELQKGAVKDAMESLRRLTELLPDNAMALRELALAQEKAGDTAEALKTITAARKLDPISPILVTDQVRLVGVRDPDRAIAVAQQFADLLPDAPAAQVIEGDYLISLKRIPEALAAYQRNQQAHPSLALAGVIAKVAVMAGKPADGEKALTDWAAAHPQDLSGRLQLADFLQGQKSAAAKGLYEKLLAEFPDNPAVLNNLALAYQREGDPRALDLARKAAAKAPDNAQIVDTLGWILTRQNSGDGVAALRHAHELAPGDLDTQYHLAFALNQNGHKADAVALLKEALATGLDFESKGDAQTLLGQLSKS